MEDVTLDAHVERVGETLEAQAEPVILVGHGVGGVIITQTAEEFPESVDLLVYLTAFLLEDGEAWAPEGNPDTVVIVDEEAGNATVAERRSDYMRICAYIHISGRDGLRICLENRRTYPVRGHSGR